MARMRAGLDREAAQLPDTRFAIVLPYLRVSRRRYRVEIGFL